MSRITRDRTIASERHLSLNKVEILFATDSGIGSRCLRAFSCVPLHKRIRDRAVRFECEKHFHSVGVSEPRTFDIRKYFYELSYELSYAMLHAS